MDKFYVLSGILI